MFFRGSRYETVPEATWVGPDGRAIRYKTVRLIPPPTAATGRYRVAAGDRHDTIAYAMLRDPEAFWRLCDLAGVMRPADLAAEPGRTIPTPAQGGGMPQEGGR